MKLVGENSFDEGFAKARKVFVAIAAHLEALGDRKAFDTMLSKLEISAEEEQQFLAVAENLTALLGLGVQIFAQRFSKEFPVKLSGRPKSLPQAQERKLCEFIGGLFLQGTQLKVCKKRAAQKFGVSLRTVERVWADRKMKKRKPSVGEMLEFLEAN